MESVSRSRWFVSLARDGSTWRVGTDAEVAWIASGTSIGRTITSAIPSGFEAYATVTLPYAGQGQDKHDRLIEAGPEQAAKWRLSGPWSFWKGALPNLMFPADRSWLVSTLWDDDWTCIGGPAQLVEKFLSHPDLQARPVTLNEDATPPGHQAL